MKSLTQKNQGGGAGYPSQMAFLEKEGVKESGAKLQERPSRKSSGKGSKSRSKDFTESSPIRRLASQSKISTKKGLVKKSSLLSQRVVTKKELVGRGSESPS